MLVINQLPLSKKLERNHSRTDLWLQRPLSHSFPLISCVPPNSVETRHHRTIYPLPLLLQIWSHHLMTAVGDDCHSLAWEARVTTLHPHAPLRLATERLPHPKIHQTKQFRTLHHLAQAADRSVLMT